MTEVLDFEPGRVIAIMVQIDGHRIALGEDVAVGFSLQCQLLAGGQRLG